VAVTTPKPTATQPQRSSELLRVATAGSVDDGKSTLIGRLLFDSKQILEDQLAAVEEASRRRSGSGQVDLSLLTDGLRAEREQGITIDVAYRYFATPRRKFIIADTPGHPRYTRNMVTGASTADLAVVLIDARQGVVQQSRRHAFISSLLRIPHLVVCVNKMDLVDWDEATFDAIVADFSAFAAKLEVSDVNFIPISALHGDNVVERSLNAHWYDGPPLLYHLEHVHIASDRNLIDARLPVQWVIRPRTDEHHDYRGYAGQVAGGVLRPADEVVVLPAGGHTRIAGIDTYDGPVDEAFPPMSVTVTLEDDLDVSRGDVICRPHNHPTVARDIDAIVCWMGDEPVTPGKRYAIKHTTRSARAVIDQILHRIDVDTLHRDEEASQLGLNDIGRILLRTSVPLVFDEYRRNRATGSFILIDEGTNGTVGAGMILGTAADAAEPSTETRSENVTWQPGRLDRERRWDALGTRGATVWFTGLPASGKSTLAGALEEQLVEAGRSAYRLDGDNLRHGLNGNLGFDPADRAENVRRTAHAARLLADAGTIALVSLVSPYAVDRAAARAVHEEAGLEFIEVFVDTPLELCEERDPKGLYARARRGEIEGMTGVDDPYEAPEAPELTVTPQDLSLALDQVLSLLADRGIAVR
jgi:bifunctional enzyme CysN/CysC